MRPSQHTRFCCPLWIDWNFPWEMLVQLMTLNISQLRCPGLSLLTSDFWSRTFAKAFASIWWTRLSPSEHSRSSMSINLWSGWIFQGRWGGADWLVYFHVISIKYTVVSQFPSQKAPWNRPSPGSSRCQATAGHRSWPSPATTSSLSTSTAAPQARKGRFATIGEATWEQLAVPFWHRFVYFVFDTLKLIRWVGMTELVLHPIYIHDTCMIMYVFCA